MWVSCNFLFVQFSLTSISVPPRCYYFMPHNCKDECPQLFTTILPQKWDFYCFFLNWKSILMILPTAGNIEWCSMIQMKKTVWFLDRQYEGTCLVWYGLVWSGLVWISFCRSILPVVSFSGYGFRNSTDSPDREPSTRGAADPFQCYLQFTPIKNRTLKFIRVNKQHSPRPLRPKTTGYYMDWQFCGKRGVHNNERWPSTRGAAYLFQCYL